MINRNKPSKQSKSKKSDAGVGSQFIFENQSPQQRKHGCNKQRTPPTHVNYPTNSIKKVLKLDLQSISNPLVVIVGIGEFDGMQDLIGISRDYCNILFSFNYIRGYNIAYFNKENKLVHLTKRITQESKILTRKNFKLRWIKEEIDYFNNLIVEKLLQLTHENGKNDGQMYGYDSLFYFVSTHGDSKNVIYDSECNKINIDEAIILKFDNKNCPGLYCKPKSFFFDCCRGVRVARNLPNINYTSDEMKQNSDKQNDGCNKKGHGKAIASGTSTAKTLCKIDWERRIARSVHELSYFRKVYGNADGYKVVEGGTKGGYLIRCLTKIIANDDLFKGLSLTDLIKQTEIVMREYVGKIAGNAAQIVEDHNLMPIDLKFFENSNTLPQTRSILGTSNDKVCFFDNIHCS